MISMPTTRAAGSGAYQQKNRTLSLTTPLGKDKLLLVGFSGSEGLSELFRFQLDALAESRTDIAFDKLLGRTATVEVELPGGSKRYFNGIVNRCGQAGRDMTFTSYRLELVPQLWLLTKRVQSRIFQHVSIPNILKEVFRGYDVEYSIQGTFHPRDYCVQYGESDFAFASRLMEEEGIYYYFKHSQNGHKLVLANAPTGHVDMPYDSRIRYEEVDGGNRPQNRIYEWGKFQEIRSDKYVAWDHSFELPGQKLNADAATTGSLNVGKVAHPLNVVAAANLEVYEFPGGYAQRFDGVDRSGGNRPDDLQHVFDDSRRTVAVRMQQEAVQGLIIEGQSNCRQLVSGHRFELTEHFNANGHYVVSRVTHKARMAGDYRTGEEESLQYENRFECIPMAVPFRPQQATPKPSIPGPQTAIVVGPPGEEIFTDKYGRVKVQFHWDRHGKRDGDSSCWIRVATYAAGKQWGAIHIPRVGHEVVVAFEEGDPDRPLIVGSVYNAENMPPNGLPAGKRISGMKSNTSLGGGGFNQISFDDTKGNERMFTHAQYNSDTVIGNNRTAKVAIDSAEEVGNNVAEKVGNDKTVEIGNNETTNIGVNQTTTAGQNIVINAGTSITLECGASRIHMNQAGFITISGTVITTAAAINASVTAPVTNITGAALLTNVGGIVEVVGGLTQVRGGKVDIIASGALVQQGAPITLN